MTGLLFFYITLCFCKEGCLKHFQIETKFLQGLVDSLNIKVKNDENRVDNILRMYRNLQKNVMASSIIEKKSEFVLLSITPRTLRKHKIDN